MTVERLPETHATLYAELLEQAQAIERLAGSNASRPGSLVAKTIRDRRYLYWQIRAGGHTVQRYLGPDEPHLRAEIEALISRRLDLEQERAQLDRLASMLLRGGAAREESGPARALAMLADLGFFRRGAVLVGTQALRCYGNALGVVLPASTLRTQDIDVAQSLEIAVASSDEPPPGVGEGLDALGFLPVPGLDPREPTTSFKARGRDLRIDFLVPADRRPAERAVSIRALGIAAQPLPFLDYLVASPMPAVMIAARPVLVRIPRPGRFALHKLWTAQKRSPAQAGKARKDRLQAQSLIAVLLQDRPDDLLEAWQALARRSAARRVVRMGLSALEAAVAEPARALLQA